MMEARYWEKLQGNVHCYLCPHQCIIPSGKAGRCGVRRNSNGTLYAGNYGVISGIALDPVEKKPLYHFNPGSYILSVGSLGCNLVCGFCQNWASVSGQAPSQEITARQLADLAVSVRSRGSCGVAFTYTEPLMWYEFVQDASKLLKQREEGTVLVSNGFIEAEPWRELLQTIDAVNIDLKAFSNGFYREHCGGRLLPVQEAIASAVGKCHLEITTLLVEGHNTHPSEIRELSAFLADLDPDIPLHLSRYYPAHKWTQAPTDPDLVRRLAEVARERLNYVYTGNLPDSWQEKTLCPQCGHVLVQRGQEPKLDVAEGHCPRCKYPVKIYIR